MINMPKIIFSFFLISYTVSANVDLECLKWFQKSKLRQTDTSCLLKCGHVSYLYLNNAERLSFKDQMGWKQSLSGDSSRKGDFVSSRAKDSPEEDFAESFLFFLKDPNFLKSKNIQAYEWLIKKYSVNFKYKKDCDNGKK